MKTFCANEAPSTGSSARESPPSSHIHLLDTAASMKHLPIPYSTHHSSLLPTTLATHTFMMHFDTFMMDSEATSDQDVEQVQVEEQTGQPKVKLTKHSWTSCAQLTSSVCRMPAPSHCSTYQQSCGLGSASLQSSQITIWRCRAMALG